MKLNFLVTTFVLLVAFPPRYECRAIDSPHQQTPSAESGPQQQSLPILARVGEEYFIRLANGNQNSAPPSGQGAYSAPSPGFSKRALQLQLTQRLLQGKVADYDSMERGRRSEEPPISLDLTFHLLREVLEMARAEQLAQQAHSNRKMMEIFGK
ncbi:corticotropin releasing hormone b [Denticeps clupeoides]|uniref:Corticotropin-releasing factor domain-containing protein n=1 Tax=Denticeps clupeoides TaxID=299321 RepID=A0AAY4ANC6_9TELE|nr:corticoliberin-1-like [Denticeps clupeoides]